MDSIPTSQRGMAHRALHSGVRRLVPTMLLVFFPSLACAFTFSNGQNITCRSFLGQPVAEVAVPTLGGQFHTGYTGITTVAPNGSAQITWDGPKLAMLPPPVHDFIYFHECAHAHVPTSDELMANCVGLADMRAAGMSSSEKEQQIGQFHASLGFMGPQYGVGSVYWANTLACANRMPASAAQTSLSTQTNQGGMTTTCRFTSGPLTGQVIDYQGHGSPAPIGSSCTDGAGSFGVAVPSSATVAPPSSPTQTTVCYFQTGPRSGQRVDYAGTPGVIGVDVGTPCTDRAGSFGVAVASTQQAIAPAPPAGAGAMSAKCRFTSGTRAGQTQDYSPRPPIPVGTPCNDGAGSFGIVVP